MVGSADLGLCLHRSSSGLDIPMKVADLFGAGVPVCALDYGACLAERVRHGDNGVLFSTGRQLADVLFDLFETFPGDQSDARSPPRRCPPLGAPDLGRRAGHATPNLFCFPQTHPLKGVSDMAKYMIKAAYGTEGTKGPLKDGGTGRRAAVQKATEAIGGKLESFYYAFGPDDAYVIVDIPDPTSAIALSLAVNASGAVHISITPLFSAEEMDAACHRTVSYRAPGA